MKGLLVHNAMTICLKTYAKQNDSQQVAIKLQGRVPQHILCSSDLSCRFKVLCYDTYYLLILDVKGQLTIVCQRCLGAFPHEYHHQTELAVCESDILAETLMERFECIVANDHVVDLVDIVTDGLYLYAPEKHAHFAECDTEISQLIRNEGEITPTTLGLQAKTR